MENNCKPTKDECFKSIKQLYESFDDTMDFYINKAEKIEYIYRHAVSGNISDEEKLKCNKEFNQEYICLAYSIAYYTIKMFEIISYSVDLLLVNEEKTKRKFSRKQYDQSIIKLSRKNKITQDEKIVLLNFRKIRNLEAHSCKFIYPEYIFTHRKVLKKLITIIFNSLRLDKTFKEINEELDIIHKIVDDIIKFYKEPILITKYY